MENEGLQKFKQELKSEMSLVCKAVVLEELSSLQLKIIESINNNKREIQSYLAEYRTMFDKDRELFTMNMEIISAETVHKIVNGNLERIKSELIEIKDWQLSHDAETKNRSIVYSEELEKYKSKIVFYALQKSLHDKPLKTIFILSLSFSFVSVTIYKLYDLGGIMSEIVNFAISIFK
jgi:hypothetical protein